MNVQYYGQSTSKFYKYLYDGIIQPTQLLIKKESQLLSLENEELKRNNEDLTNRIDKMIDDFGIVQKPYSRICETFSKDINGIERLKKSHKKTQKPDKFDKISNNTSVRNIKSQSYDSVDSGMHEIKLKENGCEIYIKNKELESYKSEILNLTKKLYDIKNQNKMLQTECKVVTKSLKNCREFIVKQQSMKHFNAGIDVSLHTDDDISTNIINGSNSCQRSSSPIYIDIFDTPEKATKFKFEHMNSRKLGNSKKKSSLLARIYSEIPEIIHDNKSFDENNLDYNDHCEPYKHNLQNQLSGVNVDLSGEIRQGFSKISDQLNKKYDELNCNFSRNSNISVPNRTENMIVLDSVRSSTTDLLNISETQKSIINLISKNSEILANLQESKSISLPNIIKITSHYLDENSNRNEACQTIMENTIVDNKQSIPTNQTSCGLNDRFQILEKVNEQNSKILNLIENQLLILNKSNEIKVTPTNSIIQNRSHAALGNSSLLNNDVNIYKNSNNTKFLNSSECILSYQDEIRKEIDHKSTSFNESVSRKFNDENSTEINDVIDKPMKKENPNKSESLKNEVIVEETVSHLFEIPKSKSLSKIPKKINNFNHTFISKSVDKLETMYSNDLESSYETLYDPIFSARSVNFDENIIHV